MSISVDHVTRIIFVPRDDLPIIDEFPETRELNLTDFHRKVRVLENQPENLIHQAEVRTLSGQSGFLNRIPPIDPSPASYTFINNYLIEFEFGLYSVNVTGGNSNISSVAIRNGVAVNTNNSAGLVVVDNTGSSSQQASNDDCEHIEHLSGDLSVVNLNGELVPVKKHGNIGEIYDADITVNRLNANITNELSGSIRCC